MKKQQKFYQVCVAFMRNDLNDGYGYVTYYRIPTKYPHIALTKAIKIFKKQTKKKNFTLTSVRITKEY